MKGELCGCSGNFVGVGLRVENRGETDKFLKKMTKKGHKKFMCAIIG